MYLKDRRHTSLGKMFFVWLMSYLNLLEGAIQDLSLQYNGDFADFVVVVLFFSIFVCVHRCLDHCSFIAKVCFFQSVGIITFSVTTCAFLKALDLWAMGVTLYCFVFGKVSLHIFCNTDLTETNLISVDSHAC